MGRNAARGERREFIYTLEAGKIADIKVITNVTFVMKAGTVYKQ